MSRILCTIFAASLSAGALAQTAAPAAAPAPAKAAAPAAAPAAAASAGASIATVAAPASGNVATVNGKPIRKADIDLFMKLVRSGNPELPDTAEVREKVREDLIQSEILFQEAHKRKIDSREEVRFEGEMAQRRVAITSMLREEVEAHKPTDAMIQSEYERQRAAMGEKEYKAHHILVESEQDAKDLIAKLDKGEKIEDLAKVSKDTGSAAKGGELDWAPAGNYVKPFGEALSKLEKGKYTAVPVKSQYGYHVIRLDDVRATTPPALEQVKPQIVEGMQRQFVRDFIEGLKKKAIVK
jgi:peptidyl-prolyl cis-trans isomerase C